MDKKKLLAGGAAFGIDLQSHQLAQFEMFEELLYERNTQFNLTRIPREDAVALHFLDSLSLIQAVPFARTATLIDVGTGAGFPGIPLKIAFPKLKITLLDSLRKRVNFLNEVILQLELKEITAIHARAEQAAHQNHHREKYDCVVARALAPLGELVELLLPFAKVGGTVVAMKSERLEIEAEQAKEPLKMLHASIAEVRSVEIPGVQARRNLVLIQKHQSTGSRFPRMRKKKGQR